MIFLTTGTQLPFDRLVRCVDEVAERLDEDIFGQIGKAGYVPTHFQFQEMVSPKEFGEMVAKARVVIGHAGIGTILTGAKYNKPVLMMARRQELGEHRNNHQLATAKQMSETRGLYTFGTTEELLNLIKQPTLDPMMGVKSANRELLIQRLRQAIRPGDKGNAAA